jgi:hypothetical protein
MIISRQILRRVAYVADKRCKESQNIHFVFNTYLFSFATLVTRTRLSVTLYVQYSAYLVTCCHLTFCRDAVPLQCKANSDQTTGHVAESAGRLCVNIKETYVKFVYYEY